MFGFELEARSCLGNIDDRTGTRRFLTLDENTRIVMELPTRLFAQFGAVTEVADDDHREYPCMLPDFRAGNTTVKRKESTLRSRKLRYPRECNHGRDLKLNTASFGRFSALARQ